MEERRLSLGEHLGELRRRVIYSVIFFGIAVILCFARQEDIMALICAPHFRHTTDTLKALGYAEQFIVYLKACLIAAGIITAPFALYQLWCFISAGLYPKERRYVYFYAPFSLMLFISGVLFSYYIFLPPALKMLFYYGSRTIVEPMVGLNDYFNIFIILTLILGAAFQLPLVMLFFVQIKILSPKFYLSHIKMAIIIAFIAAAIITPTGDPINQTLMAIPLLLLYGLGILISVIYQYRVKVAALPDATNNKKL